MAENKDFGQSLREWAARNPKISEFAETIEIERGGITYEFDYYPVVEGLKIAEKVRVALGPVAGALAQMEGDPMAGIGTLLARFPSSVVEELQHRCFRHVWFRGNGVGAQRIQGKEDEAFGHIKRGRVYLVYEVLIRSLAVNLVPAF